MSVCAGCGKPIMGTVTTAVNRPWHSTCFRCAGGGEPLAGRWYYEHDGRLYCERHYLECYGRRCAIGGEFIRGRSRTNGWGESYCLDHERGLSECYSCDRPVCKRLTGGGIPYRDGRTVCNRCRKTAIDDAATGQLVLQHVAAVLKEETCFDFSSVTIPLVLVDQESLRGRNPTDQARNVCGEMCPAWVNNDGNYTGWRIAAIRVLHGLPREHFAAICAHELGHVFLFLRGCSELPTVLAEGLCELFEYTWLMHEYTTEAKYRLMLSWKNRNPVYGTGFRACYRALYGRTLPELLFYVKNEGRLPVVGV